MNASRASFAAWQTYLKERSPLPVIATIGLLQSLSSNYLFRQELDGAGILMSTACLTFLFILMRLMDEIKDHQKDRIAHPDRPLPRGLITPAQMRSAIQVLIGGLLAVGALLFLLRSPESGAALVFTVGYSLLMYKEFFSPAFINKNAFFYAFSHQLILIPMYVFSVAMVSPEAAFTTRTLWFSLTGLGASFAFEVCRKLDPDAHPILRTYLGLHGRTACVLVIVLALGLLSVSAWQIGVQNLIWPAVGLLILFLPLVYFRPERFKLIEAASAFVGLVQLLSVTIDHFL